MKKKTSKRSVPSHPCEAVRYFWMHPQVEQNDDGQKYTHKSNKAK